MPLLHWLTRKEDLHRAARAPYRLLEEAPEISYGDPDTGNMLIQGDNLDALKALLPYYAGKVKCIYIDPPYNTKSAFEHYDDNLEHSQWLAMMYPRLELLRSPLSEDGSIWVSIDDHEGIISKLLWTRYLDVRISSQMRYGKSELHLSHDYNLALHMTMYLCMDSQPII